MTIIEKMLKIDADDYRGVQNEKMEISRLSELFGEPFIVEYQPISGRRYQEIIQSITDKKGNINVGKSFDGNLLIVIAGVVSPDLRDERLLKHFNAATPKDLAEKLFLGGEITKLANAITALSGYGTDEDTDEEIKN